MRPFRTVYAAVLIPILLAGCGDPAMDRVQSLTEPGDPSVESSPAFLHQGSDRVPAPRNFVSPLEGAQEVPPVDTRARGMAHFQLSRGGDELSYRLIVANIEDVTMAHIHLAPRGENGGVVVWLYPESPPPEHIPGRSDGILATGTITSDDLVGSLAGGTLADLLAFMVEGGAYVNVHTVEHGPGEVRGQIEVAGPR